MFTKMGPVFPCYNIFTMKEIVIAIDPGAPKKRDTSATTGVFIGEVSETMRLMGFSVEISSTDITGGISRVAQVINDIIQVFTKAGKEPVVVIEEYINYDFNEAANSFSNNETSQLIGAIKAIAVSNGVEALEQTTSEIKQGFSDDMLVARELLVKKGNKYVFPDEFLQEGHFPEYNELRTVLEGRVNLNITRHERDAYRHYLLYRFNRNYLNRIRR